MVLDLTKLEQVALRPEKPMTECTCKSLANSDHTLGLPTAKKLAEPRYYKTYADISELLAMHRIKFAKTVIVQATFFTICRINIDKVISQATFANMKVIGRLFLWSLPSPNIVSSLVQDLVSCEPAALL